MCYRFVGLLWFVSALCYADQRPGEQVSVWLRAPGDYGRALVKKSQLRHLSKKDWGLKSRKLFDTQYRRSANYLSAPLSAALSSMSYSKADTVLLHFANGMQIPIQLSALQAKPDALFIAYSYKALQQKSWAKKFPVIKKQSELWRDPRPLIFAANKVVATKEALAMLPYKPNLNPFRYADSLVAIELVHDKAWLAQLSTSKQSSGLMVFAKRCRYCHGVRKIGASYGWDFVEPLPIYKKRDPQSLRFHVAYPKSKALEMGLMMPQQKDMSEMEAKQLWAWLEHIAQRRLGAYKP